MHPGLQGQQERQAEEGEEKGRGLKGKSPCSPSLLDDLSHCPDNTAQDDQARVLSQSSIQFIDTQRDMCLA